MKPVLGWLPYLVLVVPVVAMIVRHGFFGTGPVSIGLQLAAVALNVWARVTFRARSFHAGATVTRGELVTTGPYRFVRHPIYTSIVLILAGALVAHPNRVAFACAGVALIAVAARIVLEERSLRETYPAYDEYARKTARIVPFVL